MGNTVSAAEAVASEILHKVDEKPSPAAAASKAYHHHPHANMIGTPPPECPMHQKGDATPVPPPKPSLSTATECPMGHGKDNGDINPLNMMPPPNQQPAADQPFPLPIERQVSSIPKSTPEGNNEFWVYPSQQMFWNAMLRKGLKFLHFPVTHFVNPFFVCFSR